MFVYIALALSNGLVIGTSRAINGRLSVERGAFRASLWNHLVGFAFLTLILAVVGAWQFDVTPAPPLSAYLGGLFGALFVAVNSHVFPRLGAMNAVLLVISGQMIAAVLIEYYNDHNPPTITRCLGVILVLGGVYLFRASRSPDKKDNAR
jgi:transporter family-2 protein